MQLTDLTWPLVAALSKDVPVVFPIAALEQHGHHMPLFTDSMLLGEVVRRAALKVGDAALFAPLMWLGNSEHHLDFAGTLSAAPRTYLNLLAEMLENFIHHGFRRLLLINGHGGNIVPSQQVVYELRQRHRQRNDLLLLAATYWGMGGKPNEVDRTIGQQRMMHACEWETSMMLRLAPHLVRDAGRVDPVEPGNAWEPASRGWVTQDRTRDGHIGNPRAATAEKGETIFQVFAGDVAALIERMAAWDGKGWDP